MKTRIAVFATILIASFAEAKVKTQQVAKGTMTDARNGVTYTTVKIGLQHWMAENLNYRKGTSWCYGNKSENCRKFGRLYDWQTARDVCPQGWHLPTDDEWSQLQSVVNYNALELMSKQMKGTDVYGFAVLPGGGRYGDGSFSNVGSGAYFWSATVDDDRLAWSRLFGSGAAGVHRNSYFKTYGHSVRCLAN